VPRCASRPRTTSASRQGVLPDVAWWLVLRQRVIAITLLRGRRPARDGAPPPDCVGSIVWRSSGHGPRRRGAPSTRCTRRLACRVSSQGGRRARSGRMPGCSGRRTPAQARPPPRSSSAPVIWPNPGDRQQRAEHTPLHPTATRIQAASNRRWSPLSRSEPRTVSAQGGVQRSDGGTRAPATDATGDGRESGAHNVPGTSAQGGGARGTIPPEIAGHAAGASHHVAANHRAPAPERQPGRRVHGRPARISHPSSPVSSHPSLPMSADGGSVRSGASPGRSAAPGSRCPADPPTATCPIQRCPQRGGRP
jgi:hypothetical protein